MDNYKIVVAYDGAEFYGWQKTKMGLSVEGALQKALEQILQHPVVLQAASRTDRGVHALGQVVNFFSAKKVPLISLNCLLPPGIAVLSIEKMPSGFHPTLDVKSKEYCYEICFGPIQLPQNRRHSFFMPAPSLDIAKMEQAAKLLIGSHDFSAFCLNRKKENYRDCVRTIDRCLVERLAEQRLKITIAGPAFFYKMVRCLVGTLAEVGKGKIHLSDMEKLLKEHNRALAGITVPAHGLTLVKVNY